MKLSFILLFAVIFQLFATSVLGQNTMIQLKSGTVTLEGLINEIEKQTDYLVVFSNQEINPKEEVHLASRSNTVSNYLNDIFKGTNVHYVFDKNYIILTKRPIAHAALQSIAITGTVTDETGDPMPGVNVVIKGTTNGVITDSNGKYSITVPSKESVLQFSFVGFASQESIVGEMQSINIQLKEDNRQIEEVVVVGYGVQKKVNVTGAVAQVTADRLENRPISNISQGLQGTMPGITVQQKSGMPGSTSTIRIRGFSSLNSSGALVIVDGTPGELNDVAPDDIESISVLKDAASAAIYGARAAEGVILVTTKKGKLGDKIKIQYSGNFGWRNPGRLPKANDSYSGALYANLANLNAGANPLYPNWMMDAFLDPDVTAVPRTDGTEWDYVANFDWTDYFFSNSVFQGSNSLSISGGGTRNTYMLSFSWLDQNGVFSKYGPDNYDRYNLRLNMDTHLIPEKLILSTNLSMMTSDKNLTSGGESSIIFSVYQAGSSMPMYNPDGTYARYRMQQNTMQLLKESGFDKNNTNRFEGRMSLQWNVFSDLSVKALGGYNISMDQGTLWGRSYYKYRPSGPSNLGWVNQPNRIVESSSYNRYYIMQLQADYSKSIGNHNFGAFVGTSVEDNYYKFVDTRRFNILGNELPALNLGSTTDAQNSYKANGWGLVSVFGRVNYDYEGKYLLEGKIRADGSSRFSDKHKWGYFPSVSAGWIVSREAFMQSQKVFSYLKIRASYGQVGNQNGLGFYDYIPVYTIPAQQVVFPSGAQQQAYAKSLPSQDRTWEAISTGNIGIDMSFLNNRLTFEGDIFKKINRDMLYKVEVPAIIGIDVPTNNVGKLETKGWEISIQWKDEIKSIGMRYSIGVNLYDQTDKIVDLKQEFAQLTAGVQNIQGYSVNSIFGFETAGLYQSNDEVTKRGVYQDAVTAAGDIKYVDRDKDDKITAPNDLTCLGNTTPRYAFGINLGAEWKGIDFSMFLQGVGKRNFYLNEDITHPYRYAWDNWSFSDLNDYWTAENPNARFPRPHTGSQNYSRVSSFWMQDASYIRLKNLQIGYSFPQKWLSHIRCAKARIYFSGEDLWEATNLILFDPEVSTQDGKVYPFFRSYSVGLNITF